MKPIKYANCWRDKRGVNGLGTANPSEECPLRQRVSQLFLGVGGRELIDPLGGLHSKNDCLFSRCPFPPRIYSLLLSIPISRCPSPPPPSDQCLLLLILSFARPSGVCPFVRRCFAHSFPYQFAHLCHRITSNYHTPWFGLLLQTPVLAINRFITLHISFCPFHLPLIPPPFPANSFICHYL